MKTQRVTSRPSCCWCSEPVSRPHLQLSGPSVRPGQPHHWLFCSLLCLQGWCARQRALDLRDGAIDRALQNEFIMDTLVEEGIDAANAAITLFRASECDALTGDGFGGG